jgi:hypothetical protein
MTINPSTGVISWTPAQTDVGNHTVTVRVTDSGLPPLSATTQFTVNVTGTGTQLGITRVGDLMQITIAADAGNNYELQKATNLGTWDTLIQFNPLATSPFTFIDPEPRTKNPRRFYQLKLLPRQ